MNKTVSIETAEVLRKAGFPQPEPFVGTNVFAYGDLRFVSIVHSNGEIEVSGVHYRDASFTKEQLYSVCTFAPTALDILEQLAGTHLTKKSDGMWQCSRIGEGRAIFNSNTCPHEACAKTWIEWINRNNDPNF